MGRLVWQRLELPGHPSCGQISVYLEKGLRSPEKFDIHFTLLNFETDHRHEYATLRSYSVHGHTEKINNFFFDLKTEGKIFPFHYKIEWIFRSCWSACMTRRRNNTPTHVTWKLDCFIKMTHVRQAIFSYYSSRVNFRGSDVPVHT